MRTLRAVVVLAVVGLVTGGCLSLRSYVDPQLPRVGYDNLLARSNPRPLALTVAFHRNGEPATLGGSTAKSAVRTVVEKSKLFSSVSEQPAAGVDRLDVILDNVADKGDAAGKGALTGLTFGKDSITKVYRHAIHSTIGNADAPAGLTPEPSIRAAFDKVVEGLVLNLLLDLQKEERL